MLESQSKRGDLVVLDPAFRPAVPIRSPRLKILLAGVFASLLISAGHWPGTGPAGRPVYRASDVRRFGTAQPAGRGAPPP